MDGWDVKNNLPGYSVNTVEYEDTWTSVHKKKNQASYFLVSSNPIYK